MRPRLAVVLVCFLSILLGGSPALALSPRMKRGTQEAAVGPPFPWRAVGETVGPILGIWLGTVLLQKTLSRDKTKPVLVAGEIASLPVAWFSAMTGFFEKNATERKTAPSQASPAPDSQSLTSDLWPRSFDLEKLTPPRSPPDSDF